MEYPLVTARIDLDAIRQNIDRLKQLIPETCRFMAVVKADAYGHGAAMVADAAVHSGAHWLGVARMDEAVALRDAGIDTPILIFGYVHPGQAPLLADLNLVSTVYSLEMAKALSESAAGLTRPLQVHIKVDTGMGRVGLVVQHHPDICKEIAAICRLKGLEASGIYTHFAAADAIDTEHSREFTRQQIRIFNTLIADLKTLGIHFDLCHAANSAGIMNFPEAHFDLVRAGIAIYGCSPSGTAAEKSDVLKPAMRLTSMVTSVKPVPRGFCVSYGMTWQAQQPTVLASVPIGYADGFSRRFSSNGSLLVHGCRAPIAGRVCMDQTMIDVGTITGVKTGDEVVIIGIQKNEYQSAEDLARQINTINYEIVSGLTPRVKRIYSGSG